MGQKARYFQSFSIFIVILTASIPQVSSSDYQANTDKRYGQTFGASSKLDATESLFQDKVVKVSSGANHSCAIISTGEVFCWGSNVSGELGNNSNIDSVFPVQVLGITNAKDITSGHSHSCVLLATGVAKCWGYNQLGQLGDGSVISRKTPVKVSNIQNVQQISAGNTHTCALLSDGKVNCWGYNQNGELGNGTRISSRLPVEVVDIADATKLDSGASHSCAIITTGDVRCWGKSGYGQSGDGTEYEAKPTPVSVVGITSAIDVGLGYNHSCAALASGSVYCWGLNSSGALGDGTVTSSPIPVLVQGITSVVSITGGDGSSCASLESSELFCWGYNFSGQVGDGTFVDKYSPIKVLGISNANTISAGQYHTCASMNDFGVKCWGSNFRGQLGDGNFQNQSEPAYVVGLSNKPKVLAGQYRSCALLTIGEVKCWGSGLLGDGTSRDSNTPVDVVNVSTAIEVSVGLTHSCALLAAGSVMCWGLNSYEQLGDGTKTNRQSAVFVSGITNAIAISAGHNISCAILASTEIKCWGRKSFKPFDFTPGYDIESKPIEIEVGEKHVCALFENGQVQCWGDNGLGQRGTGEIYSVGPVANLDNAIQIEVEENHSCAVTSTDEVKCWGLNSDGLFGEDQEILWVPTKIPNLNSVLEIETGGGFACVLLHSGKITCWGSNYYGGIGNGSKFDVTVPTQVLNVDFSTDLSVGRSNSCFVEMTGEVKCWGDNELGLLGDGSYKMRTAPVNVEFGYVSSARQITVGYLNSCLVLTSGSVKCWGENELGLLGDGTYEERNDAVKVVGISNALKADAGAAHTCVLVTSGNIKCWGFNSHGQLGNNSNSDSPSPVQVPEISDAVQIAVGDYHSCAMFQSGSVKCWGLNSQGQLGNNSRTNSSIPVDVIGVNDAINISAGGDTTCVVTADRKAKCWGRQLIQGTWSDSLTPLETSGVDNVDSISVASWHTCALLLDGTAKCWGSNQYGQLGNNSVVNSETAVEVLGISGGTQITSGVDFSCVKMKLGGVKCWGLNSVSQLGGDSSLVVEESPIDVVGLTDVLQIDLGYSNSCVILESSRVACWGQIKDRIIPRASLVSRLKNSVSPETPKLWFTNNLETSVTINWSEHFDGYCNIESYSLSYRQVGSNSWIDISGSVAFQSITIENLLRYHIYEFKLGVQNCVTRVWTETYNIIVGATSPDAPVVNLDFVTSSEVGLQWAKPFDGGSLITDYIVQFRELGSLVWLTFVEDTSVETWTSISRLQPGVTYEFRIGAQNSLGTTFSLVTLATTDPAPPDAPVVTVDEVSPTSVVLTWSTPYNGGAAILDYVVEYRVSGAITWLTYNDGVSTSTSVNVTGLMPGITYEFRVGAVNSAGTSLYGEATATTDPAPPDAPVVTVDEVSPTSVVLTWSTPYNGGAAILDYVVEYRVSGAITWLTYNDGVSTSTSVNVTGLMPGITYEFRVGAVNSAGTTYSQSVTETTGFTISSVNPLSVSRGSALEVSGEALSLVSEVRIGSLVVAFRFVSDSLIVVTVPMNATSGNLLLLSASQEVVAGALTVSTRSVAPTITAVEPYVASPGAVITVRGSNVGAATDVKIGSVSQLFSVTGRGTLTVVLPNSLVNGKVTVTTPGGSVTSSGTVVVPPRVTTTGLSAGVGVLVSIAGENMVDVTSVVVGGKTVTPASKTATSVSFTIPNGAISGSGTVTGPGGISNSFTFQLLNPPTLNTFSLSAKIGETITLTGTNLQNVTAVRIGSVVATSFSSTETTVTFVVPTGSATGTVTFSGIAGTVTSTSTLTILQPPVITSMSPTSGRVGTTVTISGRNLSNATVYFGTRIATKSSNTATQIKVKVPTGLTKGTYTVRVVTANGETTRTFRVT